MDIGSMMKSYRTTLAWSGFGTAVATSMGWTLPDGKINWAAIVTFALSVIGGYLNKDRDVTGGTVPATVEAEARAEGAGAEPSEK